MGSGEFYIEERPVHKVAVTGFWIDRYPVTNEQFTRFVAETGYVTLAERPLNPADFPGAPIENLVPGSMVFQKTKGPVDLRNYANWWRWSPGANWRHPHGPSDRLEALEEHPVVHVSYEDAAAYAKWIGKDLPTEAEWEYAAPSLHSQERIRAERSRRTCHQASELTVLLRRVQHHLKLRRTM